MPRRSPRRPRGRSPRRSDGPAPRTLAALSADATRPARPAPGATTARCPAPRQSSDHGSSPRPRRRCRRRRATQAATENPSKRIARPRPSPFAYASLATQQRWKAAARRARPRAASAVRSSGANRLRAIRSGGRRGRTRLDVHADRPTGRRRPAPRRQPESEKLNGPAGHGGLAVRPVLEARSRRDRSRDTPRGSPAARSAAAASASPGRAGRGSPPLLGCERATQCARSRHARRRGTCQTSIGARRSRREGNSRARRAADRRPGTHPQRGERAGGRLERGDATRRAARAARRSAVAAHRLWSASTSQPRGPAARTTNATSIGNRIPKVWTERQRGISERLGPGASAAAAPAPAAAPRNDSATQASSARPPGASSVRDCVGLETAAFQEEGPATRN